jgi:hypothetical protein
VNGVWMDERDLEAEEATARARVDQLGPFGGELVEGDADVVDLESDVVHSGAPLREELADRRVLAERGEQLDPVGADAQRRRLDALLLERLAVLELGPEEPVVRGQRRVEIVDGNAQVMNAVRLHAAAMLLVGADHADGADGLGGP